MEAQHGWPLRVPSRRKSSAEERVGGVCVGEDDFGVEPSSVIEPRLVLSALSSRECFLEKLFRRRQQREKERERERSESVVD